jgi:SET domain-containing protein
MDFGDFAADFAKFWTQRCPSDKCLALPISVDGKFCIGKDYPVEVKSAGDKGMGVFATKNIKRGSICCYYDGFICADDVSSMLTTGEHNFGQQIGGGPQIDLWHLAGFRSQLRNGGCAQMCNDASTTYTDDEDLTYLKNINVTAYNMRNESGQPGFFFVATKRIKKGEELLYSYGSGFWNGKYAREARPEDEDHSVKAYFKKVSDDVIAKLDQRIAKSTSEKEIRRLKGEKEMIDIHKKGYDTEGKRLEDYGMRYMLTQFLLDIQKKVE